MIDLVEKEISDNGGKVGESCFENFKGAYREEFSSSYITGGLVKVPQQWKKSLFSEPMRTSDGTIRQRRDGTEIWVNGIIVEQEGLKVKLALGAFQKSGRVYDKDGNPQHDQLGNSLRLKSSGAVVDLYKEKVAANTLEAFESFFKAIAGKTLSITMTPIFTKMRTESSVHEMNIPTIEFAD